MSSENIPMTKPRKLTRKEIAAGLEAMPIERILLGGAKAPGRALTAKQTAFAEEIAKGETKAGAYRKAYKSKGRPKTVHARGAELARDSRIQAAAAEKRAEMEAVKLQTPAQIREQTIRALVAHAQDDSFPPAQRVKCLELLGKITEVALFTERREVVQVTDAQDAKARLLHALRAAMARDALTVDEQSGESLIAEIKTATAEATDADADPPAPAPQDFENGGAATTHSIPHTQSAPISKPTPTQNEAPPTWEDISTSQITGWEGQK